MRPDAKNLEAISRAMTQHSEKCLAPVVEIRMNHFEVERLGWNEFQGVPIIADDEIPTGRFRLVCAVDHNHAPATAIQAREMVPV